MINRGASRCALDKVGPNGSLIIDSNGNVFGTTIWGGDFNHGAVFEVKAGSNTLTTLASFVESSIPVGSLFEDSSGNLYGTTQAGGVNNSGTVFEVVAGSGTITTLACINDLNGNVSNGGLVRDSHGNLFGTTANFHGTNSGTVFEATAGSNRTTILAFFNGDAPNGGLVVDSDGNLFGTTDSGGAGNSGTLFEVKAGTSTITTLASFSDFNLYSPIGGLIGDSNGGLLGITMSNGNGDPTIFQVTHLPTAPTSSVNPLPNFSPPTFAISWSGQDHSGSGIAHYDLFVSDNGGVFTPLLRNTQLTSITFNGQLGHTYGFFSIATDQDGNVQTRPTVAQSTTHVLRTQTITFGKLANKKYGDASFSLRATASSGLPVVFHVLSGPATINGNVLTIAGAGTATIEASQAGNGTTYAAAAPVDESFTVMPASTRVGLTPSANPAKFGQTITLTAKVSVPASTTVTPTGTVTFKEGASVLGIGTLNNGVASFQTATLAVGRHTLSAVYVPDTSNETSSTSTALTLTVSKAATKVVLQASPAPTMLFGQPVTLIATVSIVAPGMAAPGALVTFKDGATVLGTGNLNNNGVATLTTTSLTRGKHRLTAVYSGDGDTTGSISATVNETVT